MDSYIDALSFYSLPKITIKPKKCSQTPTEENLTLCLQDQGIQQDEGGAEK
jgi:hypothetical protein